MRWVSSVLLSILFVFLGCDKPAAQAPRPPEKIKVMATAYPLADIARQVGGDMVQCEWVAEQGQSLDAIDPTPEVRAKLRNADMVLTSGHGEEWAGQGFDDPLRAKAILRLDVFESAQADLGCPQLWLDPQVARELASVIAERLVIKRPNQTDRFRQQAQRVQAEIDKILSAFAGRLTAIKGKKVLVVGEDYSALTRSLGLPEVHPVNVPVLRLSSTDMLALRNSVRTDSPAAMLVEVGLPTAVREDLGKQLGVPIIELDSLGTSAGEGRNTYESLLRYNLEQLCRLSLARSSG